MLEQPIQGLPGAGPITAARLRDRGLESVGDLLAFFPRGYEDYRRVYRIADLATLPAGTSVVVQGTVVRVHRFFRRLLDVYVDDGGHRLRARWFRPNAGMVKTYARGSVVALAGSLRFAAEGEPELIHPSNVTAVLADAGVGIRPRYPVVAKVPGRTVEKLVDAAVALAVRDGVETLPEPLRARLGLPPLAHALTQVHRPPSDLSAAALSALRDGSSEVLRRFAFEELLVLQLALARERARTRTQRGFACVVPPDEIAAELQAALPFTLTPAQDQAVQAICAGLAGPAPMQCLLQGDVGSGKTAVVFGACLAARRASGQTLLMAPTTVLAEQHHRTLQAWAAPCKLRVGLLHAALPSQAQREVLAAAAAGELDVVVGTHALLEDRLRLARLALAVVDEQHRFGVRQRAALRRLGGENGWKTGAHSGMVPHLLVLSATPIPRSLALTLYGDLDLVTLEGVPPGRAPIVTRLCRGAQEREAAYQELRQTVSAGGQGFVVCPAVAESEAGHGTSAITLARELREKLGNARVGLLHGQLRADRQQAVADAFRAGRLDLLVATTVVEVGIDVPGARIMIVEDAERFGLAQLHQLRGRVGRGRDAAACFLLTDSSHPDVLTRLTVVAEVSDGFRIAEADLRYRGAGDVHGTRQTGTPELRFANPAVYLDLLASARREAEALLASDPELTAPAHAALTRAVEQRTRAGRAIAEEAG